jgi:hypothetical protein
VLVLKLLAAGVLSLSVVTIAPGTVSSSGDVPGIGIGARMGNGLLLAVLASLVVEGHGASVAEASALTAAVSALFLLSFASLAARPQGQ